MRDHDYWVYILTNKSQSTLYTGVTSQLGVRLAQHKTGEKPGFTTRYHLDRLVWFEHFRDIRDAITCEKRLKGWRRERKIEVIERTNPKWHDLSRDLYEEPPVPPAENDAEYLWTRV